ncbi:hypothetical protein [Argonema galeatum]|nr:hypothetical protein [Argonema galeatum]MCL1464902.1 hypothetical protein [Argonema galeatum A003/A1]
MANSRGHFFRILGQKRVGQRGRGAEGQRSRGASSSTSSPAPRTPIQ